MKRHLSFVLLLAFIWSCTDSENQVTTDIKFYRNEIQYLNDELHEIVRDLMTVQALDPYEDTKEYFDYKLLDIKFDAIKRAIEKPDYSNQDLENDLRDSLISSYLIRDLNEYVYLKKEIEVDSLNKLYQQLSYLRIQKVVYNSLLGKEMGCATLSDLKVVNLNYRDKSLILFGIFDTNASKKIIIDSLFLNGQRTEIEYEITHTNSYSTLSFNDSGLIKYYGRYKVLNPNKTEYNVPFSGQIKK